MNNPNNQLPQRFNEQAFRRYEGYIKAVVDNMPAAVAILPKDFPEGVKSPVTFSCRFRDAVKSLRSNQWATVVDLARFLQCCDEIVVAERDGGVVIGNAETVKFRTPSGEASTWAPAPSITVGPETTKNWTVNDPDILDINALVHLLSRRQIDGPIVLTNVRADVAIYFKDVEMHNDICFEQDGERWLVL